MLSPYFWLFFPVKMTVLQLPRGTGLPSFSTVFHRSQNGIVGRVDLGAVASRIAGNRQRQPCLRQSQLQRTVHAGFFQWGSPAG